MKPVVFILSAVILLSTSCQMLGGKRVRGNGHVVKESRTIQPFKDLDVSGNFEVRLTEDSVASLSLETDENLLPLIEIRQDGDHLSIDSRNGYSLKPSHKLVVYLSGSGLNRVQASGACTVIGKNKIGNGQPISFDLSGACDIDMDVKAEKVRIDASGACNAKLSGECRDLEIDGEGATEIHCFGLMAENTDISLSGAGDAEVFASVSLKASTSGAADIRYKGEAKVTSNISGAGSIKKQ